MSDNTVNTWDIIDTFFRDTPYYKSQHQIDSFDEFLFSKENGLHNIVTRENPFILFKGESKGKFLYELRIHFGETLNEEGNPLPDVENIFVSSQAIFKDDKLNAMFPNEARLKSLTYQSNVLCNIGIQYIFHDEEEKTYKWYNRKSFKDKMRRIAGHKPSPTLVAHMAVDTYMYIHPSENRTITPREAARIQSFPDSFHFSEVSFTSQYRQIGNAVPPLMGKAIAEEITKKV